MQKLFATVLAISDIGSVSQTEPCPDLSAFGVV
jgi:hypothetical protein